MGVKVTPRMMVQTRPGERVTAVGTIAYDSDSGFKFLYVTAGAAIAAFDAVRVNADLADVRPTSAVNQVVLGVAQAAIASGASGWIQIDGKMTCKVAVATAVGAPLATSAAAGTLAIAAATDTAGSGRAVALVTGVAAGSAVYFT